MNIVGWQPDGAVTSVVSNGQVAVLADMDDGPTVSVFDPVVGSEAESADGADAAAALTARWLFDDGEPSR